MATKVYILSQLNAKKVKEELMKIYKCEVNFELMPLTKAKEGTFNRELLLSPEDLENVKDAEIIIADNMFMPQLMAFCPKLKWIQGTYAGVDTVFARLGVYFNRGIAPTVLATRFSGPSFGKLMSDYCLGYIIAIERNLLKFRDVQHVRDWQVQLAQQSSTIYRTLDELNVTVLGYGAIGAEMCKCFSRMGCTVTAFARTPRPLEEVMKNGVSKLTTDLNEALKSADYIVSILPDTPATMGLLNGPVLRVCAERKPTFINVGRGTIISTSDIINALDSEWISNAVLDVFQMEPLPEDNPLWVHPDVVVTPHISALTKPADLAEVFRMNYEHYKKGEPLEMLINWLDGY